MATARTCWSSIAALALALAALTGPVAQAAQDVDHFELEGTDNRPYAIVAGPDGNMWFTQSDGDAIGRISPRGKVKRYGLEAGSTPYGITVGPDGNLWFTERLADRIGVMSTSGELLAEYDLPTPNAQPWDIALGGDGALWFTEENVDQIGRITVDGTITEFPLTLGTFPTGIAADGKGDIWFTLEIGNVIGRLQPRKSDPFSTLRLFDVPTEQALPYDITLGPDGAMWFSELAGRQIGRVGRRGTIKEYAVPGESGIAGITAGPDGRLWFTQNDIASVGTMTTKGRLGRTYASRPYPFGIAAGADGNVWFCEGYGDSIGRVRVRSGGGPQDRRG